MQVGELRVVLRDRQRGGVGDVGIGGAVHSGEELRAGGVPEGIADIEQDCAELHRAEVP